MVQWLRAGASTAGAWVQDLVKELRSHKPSNMTKKEREREKEKTKKKKKKSSPGKSFAWLSFQNFIIFTYLQTSPKAVIVKNCPKAPTHTYEVTMSIYLIGPDNILSSRCI